MSKGLLIRLLLPLLLFSLFLSELNGMERLKEGRVRNADFLHPCMRCCISLVLIRGESDHNDEVMDTDVDLYPISFHFILSIFSPYGINERSLLATYLPTYYF